MMSSADPFAEHSAPDAPAHARDRRPRVAMLVLNPCANDARVLRSAQTLAARGAHVRVFALGNSLFPGGLVTVDGVEVHRLEVRSWFVRGMAFLRGVYLALAARPGDSPREALRRASRGRRVLALIALPVVVLLQSLLGGSDAAWHRPRHRAPLGARLRKRRRRVLTSVRARAKALRRRFRVARWRTARRLRTGGRRARYVVGRLLPGGATGPTARRLSRAWRAGLARLRHLATALRAPGTQERRRRRRQSAAVRAARRRRDRRRRRTLRQAARRRRVLRRRRRVARRGIAVTRARRRVLRAVYLGLRRVVRSTLLPVHRPSTLTAFWTAAEDAMGEWRPDVAHAHDLNTLQPARRIGDRLGVPVVYDSHELWRHRNRHGQLRPLGRLADAVLEHRLAPSADAVIAVSPSIGAWLERTYRLRQRVHIVRNTPRFHSPRAAGAAPGVLDRSPGEQLVVYSGRFTTGRGLEEMIDALVHLPPRVVLAAVGYGDDAYVASLLRRATRRGVSGRVRLHPAVEPDCVPAAVAEGDVALVAIEPSCLSYRYALPNKLFEAVQARVPVVASDLPDIGALMDTYGIGERYRVGDPRALADAVRRVLADPQTYRAAMGRAATELCWENESEALLDCYASIGLDLRPRRRGGLDRVPTQRGPHHADRVPTSARTARVAS